MMLTTIGLLGWSGYQMMQLEKQAMEAQANRVMTAIALQYQYANFTNNNIAGLYSKSEIEQRMAFAAGITQNKGKIGIFFDKNETDTALKPAPEYSKVPIIKLEEIAARTVYMPALVRTIAQYEQTLKDSLKKAHIHLNYRLYKQKQIQDIMANTEVITSSPLIINVLDPIVYYIDYKITPSAILRKMSSYLGLSILILAMVSAAFTLYMRSYKLQMQLVQFREALFSNITHELKTPLSSMRLIIESAAKEVFQEQVRISKSHLDFAGSELNRMSLMIDKILSFGKMNKEQFELNKTYVQLDKIIPEAIAVMQLNSGTASIQFLKSENVTLLGDELLLTNMLTSLLDNALKYNSCKPEISISLELTNNAAVIMLSDNGIGIPDIYHRKIFEPFFRVPTGNEHDVKGHGLGLSFVAQAVRLHGGKIGVQSAGQGTIFTITIPITQ